MEFNRQLEEIVYEKTTKGKKTGAICGGVGMALYDLLSGWMAWVPFGNLVQIGVAAVIVLVVAGRLKILAGKFL